MSQLTANDLKTRGVAAIEAVLAEQKLRTRDLGGPADTSACGKAIAERLA